MANYMARLTRQWGGTETRGGEEPTAIIAPRLPTRFETGSDSPDRADLETNNGGGTRTVEEGINSAPVRFARTEPTPHSTREVTTIPVADAADRESAESSRAAPPNVPRRIPLVPASSETAGIAAQKETGVAAIQLQSSVVPPTAEGQGTAAKATAMTEVQAKRPTEISVPLREKRLRETTALHSTERTAQNEVPAIATPITSAEQATPQAKLTQRGEEIKHHQKAEEPPAPLMRPALVPLVVERESGFAQAESAQGRRESFAAPAAAPTVHITIGRVEIRAASGAKAPPTREKGESSVMTLEAYLQQQAARQTAR